MQHQILNPPRFEGIPVFTSNLGDLKHGAAFALPGVGIFVRPRDAGNIDLLRHEFGHILQARLWGYSFFYGKVVSTSISSAMKANANSNFNHQHTWTEWTANWLAYTYFKSPSNWNVKRYPFTIPENRNEPLPQQVKVLMGKMC